MKSKLLLIGTILLASQAHAAVINIGGQCTLVRAIDVANNDRTARGRCTQGNGADMVVLPASTLFLLKTVNNNALGPVGLPVIRTPITINGNGSTIKRDSKAPAFTLVVVASGGTLTANNIKITGATNSFDAAIST